MNFAELLETRAREKGEEIFLLFDDERVSYAALDRRTNRIANGLAALGVGPGAGVAIMMGNSPTWLATFFAAQKLGAYAVPINIALRGEGLAYILGHSETQALVIGAELLDAFTPLHPNLPRVRHVIVDSTEADAGATLPGDVIPIERFANTDAGPPGTAVTPGTTAILLYTSGTTGLPKAVVVRHGGFSFAGLAFFAQVGYCASDILYTCLPLFHANALFLTTMQGLFSGYPVAQLCLPVPPDCSCEVAGVILLRVDIDLDKPSVFLFEMFERPIGRNQDFRMNITIAASHSSYLLCCLFLD